MNKYREAERNIESEVAAAVRAVWSPWPGAVRGERWAGAHTAGYRLRMVGLLSQLTRFVAQWVTACECLACVCVWMMHLKKKIRIVKKCKTITEKWNKGMSEEKKYTQSFECNIYWHTFANALCVCVCVFLRSFQCELWGRCLQQRAALPVSSNRLFEHIAPVSPRQSVCLPSVKPPFCRFHLFIVDLCSIVTWPHVYLCFPLSPASPRRAVESLSTV